MQRRRWQERLAAWQGIYFATTGIWPLVHLRSFEAVTGPKADGWLVKTAGVLIGVIGAAVTSAGMRRRVTPEIVWLAAGAAAGLGAIDVWYSLRGRISKIHLLDAVLEAGLIAGWMAPALAGRAASRRAWHPAFG